MYSCQLCGESSALGETLNRLHHWRIVRDKKTQNLRPEMASEIHACPKCNEECQDKPEFQKPEPPYRG